LSKMSRAKVHKKRLLRLITQLREEVCKLYEEHHVVFPNKSMHELELDIYELMKEIERTELVNEKH